MEIILFLVIVLLSNVIQGLTGFAGTILAMPFSLMLVGYDVAKPILNVLGILSGLYVFTTSYKFVNWKELRKIVIVMMIGIIGGIFIKSAFGDSEEFLYMLLGLFVIGLSINGLFLKIETPSDNKLLPNILLIVSGIVHGLFVSGGPLLIGYLTKIIKDKVVFRATISTVWIFLNSIILLDDIKQGLWNTQLIYLQFMTIPMLAIGMFVGTKLYYKMTQETFMKVTYVLLLISGISLLI